MKSTLIAMSCLVHLCTLPATLLAADTAPAPLTLARVIELSSTNAPEVQMAATRVAEGEAKLDGARVRSLENPRLSLAAGPRSGDETSLDLEAELEVPVELGKRRDKRIALADAGIRRERHAVADARRVAVAAAVGAWYRVLQAEERLGLARDRKTLAGEVFGMASERHAAGDVARFEVNLAQTELARAESALEAEKGRAAAARGALARALGLPSASGLQISGSMKERSFFDVIGSSVADAPRSDLLTAQAEVDAAQAAVELAQAETRPDLALTFGVKREGDENVALAGVSITLPFFNPRSAQVREARIQHDRAHLAAELTRTGAAAEIEGARQTYAAAAEAVRRIETDLPLQKENETLASESYRAGKINLSTLLQLRRDALETRQEYLERLLEAAEAGVALASATGSWETGK